jgi:hypothetical protein
VGLQQNDGLGSDVGHNERVGVLFIGEWPGAVTVQGERPQADLSHFGLQSGERRNTEL